jgi:hypothetical protein
MVATVVLEIPPRVLFPSLAIGSLLMILLTWRPVQVLNAYAVQVHSLRALANVLDVTALQLVSFLFLIWSAYSYFATVTVLPKKWVFLLVSVALIAAMVLEYLFEVLFLKPSFQYGSNSPHLDPVLWGRLAAMLGVAEAERFGGPSGFALRQTLILLNFLVLANQAKWATITGPTRSYALYSLHVGVFVIVCLLRIGMGNIHNAAFDVGIGIGVALFAFWVVLLMIKVVVSPTAGHLEYLEQAVAPLGLYGIAILFYCQETKFWIWVLVGVFVAMALLHLFVRRSESAEGAKW